MKLVPMIVALICAGAVFVACGPGPELREYQRTLIQSATDNDIAALRDALEGTDAARQKYLEGWTLLHIASRWDVDRVSRLCFGSTMSAAKGIFQPGTAVRQTAETGAALLALIIERGGDPGAANDDGDTPLHVALDTLNRDVPDVPSIPPVRGRITSGYGWRGSPFDNNSDYHRGLDIAARNGTPVYATADGIVEETGISDELGNYIVVRHRTGSRSVYGHCHLFAVRKRSFVRRGAVIGYVGRTGASTGDHCHYEVRLNGAPVDPAGFINLKAVYDAQQVIVKAAVELLLSKKAPVDARNREGCTPLLEAAAKSRDIAILLVEHGADVNICDLNGVTPLHAAAAGDPELVQRLLDRGAQVNPRTRSRHTAIAGTVYRPGISPLGVALMSDNKAAVELLQNYGAVQ